MCFHKWVNLHRYAEDQQIAQLVERCKKFEEEAAEKNRAVDAMRARMGRDRGGGGGGSMAGTPSGSAGDRSMTSPANSAASSFAFGSAVTRGGGGGAAHSLDQSRVETSTPYTSGGHQHQHQDQHQPRHHPSGRTAVFGGSNSPLPGGSRPAPVSTPVDKENPAAAAKLFAVAAGGVGARENGVGMGAVGGSGPAVRLGVGAKAFESAVEIPPGALDGGGAGGADESASSAKPPGGFIATRALRTLGGTAVVGTPPTRGGSSLSGWR